VAWCGVFRRQIYNRSLVNYKIDERDDGWKFNVEFSPCQSARLESSSAASNLALPLCAALLIQNTACRHTEKLMLSVRESLCTAQRQLNGITFRVRGFYLDRYKLARLECLIKILKGVQLSLYA
jgi:hypothetical protein